MVPEYPSNSNKSKEEARKQLNPVVSKPAETRKKKNKLFRMVFAQDLTDIKQELMTGYIGPKIKDLSWAFIDAGINTISNAFRMMVYEDFRPTDRSRLPAERYSYNNYSGYYSQPATTLRPTMTTELNYDEFTYRSYGEADAVLTALKDQLAQYKCATVHDLYQLSGITTTNYTLQDYGWTNLDFAEVRQTSEGYIIALPKAKPLKR